MTITMLLRPLIVINVFSKDNISIFILILKETFQFIGITSAGRHRSLPLLASLSPCIHHPHCPLHGYTYTLLANRGHSHL